MWRFVANGEEEGKVTFGRHLADWTEAKSLEKENKTTFLIFLCPEIREQCHKTFHIKFTSNKN